MAVLTADRNFSINGDVVGRQSYPVKDAALIYKGAMVSPAAADGYAHGLVAAEKFLGVAEEKADNSAGADGAIEVVCLAAGTVRFTGQSGFAQTNLGATVYASDDATLTTTSAGNSAVGTIVRVESASIIWVKLNV
jgi:hypothetical protein